jgi:hypothetical protein
MSPRWNWDSPTPLAAGECALHPGPKGGGAHSPAAKGEGESLFQRLEKRLALCLLCGPPTPWGLNVYSSKNYSNSRVDCSLRENLNTRGSKHAIAVRTTELAESTAAQERTDMVETPVKGIQ